MIRDTLWLLAELTALFFGVAFIIHLIQRRFGTARLRAWMGGTPLASALKGIAIGFITPFCTYSAIPMLIGFRQAGVPPSGYVAFISAAPVLDPVLFGALVVIVGLEAALLYSAVAFTAAITLALVAQHTKIDRHLKPVPSAVAAPSPQAVLVQSAPTVSPIATAGPPPGQACGTIDESSWRGSRIETLEAAQAAIGLLRSVALLLLTGIVVGLLIESTVSPSTVATLTGDNGIWSIPAAAGLGTPLYFHTSLFVPIADALTEAGVGIGAIVALTISGAGANVPEFIVLTKLASRHIIAIFFAYVFAVALVGGLIAEAILR
ncbi:MAG: hypothetical protein GY773_05020 [Actinomycetia bacterium]|nr:hypothetical protein [Actinomycetes bacterium]